MAGRFYVESGGLSSYDDHHDEPSGSAAAAAAVAHRASVTAAAIAGKIQGAPPAAKAGPPPRPPGLIAASPPPGTGWQTSRPSSAGAAAVVFVPASPPHRKAWQTPQPSSPRVARTIAKPKAPKAKGANTKEALSLVAAALSTATTVEYMANMDSEGRIPSLTRPVSSGDGDGGEPIPRKLCRTQGQHTLAQTKAKVGTTLPLMEHAHGPTSSAESRALAPRHPIASTFAGRNPH